MAEGAYIYALGQRPRADDLAELATISSRAPAGAAVIVVEGCLQPGAFVRRQWEAALHGVWRASQVTVGHLSGAPSADDAALHVLTDALIVSDELDVERWAGALLPPRRFTLAEWVSQGFTADGADLAECLEEMGRWPKDVLLESRALARGRESAATEAAIAAWLDARERLSQVSDV